MTKTAGHLALARPSRADIARFGKKDGAGDTMTLPELSREFKKIGGQLKDRDNEIKTWTEKAIEEIKATGLIAAETKANLETQAATGAELQARMQELEQLAASLKAAMPNGGQKTESLGRRFTDNEDVKSFLEGKSGFKSAKMKVKAITSTTSGDGGAGDLIMPQRVPGIIRDPDRPFVVRDLLSSGRTSTNSVEFVQETGFTNNAAPVAEGAEKPQSSISFDLQ